MKLKKGIFWGIGIFVFFVVIANSGQQTENKSNTNVNNFQPQVLGESINQNTNDSVEEQLGTNTNVDVVEKLVAPAVSDYNQNSNTNTNVDVAQPQEPIHYYENSQGNTVQSPTHYDAIPAGATAKCGDGSYSFSQSRRGTCSHHGGVSIWY